MRAIEDGAPTVVRGATVKRRKSCRNNVNRPVLTVCILRVLAQTTGGRIASYVSTASTPLQICGYDPSPSISALRRMIPWTSGRTG